MSEIHRAWAGLMARIDPMARRVGLYTAYPLPPAELIASEPTEAVSTFLHERLTPAGYHTQWLAATKYHPETGEIQDASCRRVPDTHPDIDSRLTRNWSPDQCQFHVHLWNVGDRVEVFSHYELRPDVFRPTIDIGRLREHYRPAWGATYLPGVSDEEVPI